MRSRSGFLILTLVALGGTTAPAAAQAQPPQQDQPGQPTLTARQRADKERREKKSLAEFSAGRYQEAIEMMAELYVDFQEPMYLRNIGRCHQRLGDPDRAIAAFEEYLAKSRNATQQDIDSTRELIKQMQELKQRKIAESAPPPPPPRPAPPPEASPAPAVQATALPGAGGNPAVTLRDTPPAPAPSPWSTGRIAGVALLGGGVALAAAGGVVLGTSWSEYNRAKDAEGCPASATPECHSIADRVKSRNLLAKILFAAGAFVGAVGGVELLLTRSSPAQTAAAAALPDEVTVAFRGRF